MVSYTPFSPLPETGGSFLLHFPVSHLNLTLSGILLYEARTFLSCTWQQRPFTLVPLKSILSNSFLSRKSIFLNTNVANIPRFPGYTASLLSYFYTVKDLPLFSAEKSWKSLEDRGSPPYRQSPLWIFCFS